MGTGLGAACAEAHSINRQVPIPFLGQVSPSFPSLLPSLSSFGGKGKLKVKMELEPS